MTGGYDEVIVKPIQRTHPKALETFGRQLRALEMRRAGMNYQQIADALGYQSVTGARQAVSNMLTKALDEPAEEVRRMELLRLDAMLNAIWTFVMAGDLEAIDRAIKIETLRCKLLGLQQPVKVDIELRVRTLARSYGLSEDEAVGAAQEYIRQLNAGATSM